METGSAANDAGYWVNWDLLPCAGSSTTGLFEVGNEGAVMTKRGNRVRIRGTQALLILLALAAVLLPTTDGGAVGPTAGTIDVSLTNNWVNGPPGTWDTGFDIEVIINDVDDSGLIGPFGPFGVEPDGSFFLDASVVGSANMTPGDIVTVNYVGVAPETGTTLTLEGPLSLTVDNTQVTASGDRPDKDVSVNVGGSLCDAGSSVPSDGTTTWLADYSLDCPTGFGDDIGGSVAVFDANGNATLAEPTPPPRLHASTYAPTTWNDRDRVEGYNFEPGSTITLEVDLVPLTPSPVADGDGNWYYDGADTPLI